MVAALRRPALPKSAVILIAAVGLLVADVVAHGQGKMPAALVLAIVVMLVAAHVASRWSWLVSGLVIVDLLIPSDGRYTLAGGLPSSSSPTACSSALLLVGWIASLLCDPRVKIRRTGFEGPLGLILFSIVGSLLLNPSRVSGAMSFVIKSVSLEASFLLVIYLVVSVVRTRAILDWLVKILVIRGHDRGRRRHRRAQAAVQHLQSRAPAAADLPFQHASAHRACWATRSEAEQFAPRRLPDSRSSSAPRWPCWCRSRSIWASRRASAGGMARRWCMLAGDFAGGSRTGLIAIVVMLIVFLWLRPRQTLRCWPALIPLLIVVHFLDPGAIGGFYNSFFPQGGLVAAAESDLHRPRRGSGEREPPVAMGSRATRIRELQPAVR